MKEVLHRTAIGLAIIIFALLAVTLAARRLDGPLGPLAGGALRTGALVEEPVLDWSFASETDTVEMQLLFPPRSRTTWILVRRGEAYIPCGTPGFRLWKQWPHEALRDGRAIVRTGGRRHPVILVRVTDRETTTALVDIMQEKYGAPGAGVDAVWYFHIDPSDVEIESP